MLAGRYRLAHVLGHGGAGQVWRADDLELGRPVAVKLLQQSGTTGHVPPDAIRAEARKAARLVHPNVVAVYDVVTADDGSAFLVMELVDGPNLAEVLRTTAHGQAASAEVADVAVQIARALDAAHAAGVVHCDIKPGNLLLAPDGTVKVTDFGIAATSVTAAAATGSGQNRVLLGTASYVSPEQVRGQPATPASDWYALGCVLYELLAGRPPFVADTIEEVLGQHIHTAPVPIQTIRPDVNGNLAAVVMALLAKDPNQRPSSARTVSAAVSGSRAPDPSGQTQVLPVLDSVPPAAAAHDAPMTRRRRRLLPIAAIATAALILAAAVAVWRDSTTSTDAGQPQPGLTTSATAAPRPSSPRPSATRSTPKSPASKTPTAASLDTGAALTTLAQLLRQQGRGREAKVGREAAKDIDQVAADLAAGETDKAAEKYRDTRKRLTEAQRDGRWIPTPQITALLGQLDRTLVEGN